MKEKELQLVTFEQAKRLKKLGFDYPVDSYYHETDNDNDTPIEFGRKCNFNEEGYYCYSAPTIALVLKWIRDEKRKNFTVNLDYANENGSKNYFYEYKMEYACGIVVSKAFYTFHNPSAYEECERALLDKLLTILEK